VAVQIFNNWIVRNGLLDPPINSGRGGVMMLGQASGAGELTGRVEHNTIALNHADSAYDAAGIICVSPASIPLQNNIVSSNYYGVVTTPQPQVAGCSHTYTLGYPLPPAGATNSGQEPIFVAAAGNDFHLMPTSPGVGDAAPSDVEEDIDGDPRPESGRDIGADEVTR
jgi:hypothetical protein